MNEDYDEERYNILREAIGQRTCQTDKEMIQEYFIEEEDQDDHFSSDDEYKNENMVKIVPFSIKPELNAGSFDKNGNYVPFEETEEESNSEYEEEDIPIYDNIIAINSLEGILAICTDLDLTVNDLLRNNSQNEEQFFILTESADNLLSMGHLSIYQTKCKHLQSKLLHLLEMEH